MERMVISMLKILISDPLHQAGLDYLNGLSDFQADVQVGLTPEQLLNVIPAYHGIVVRSETQVSADVLEAGELLQVVGRAGVGVDNIDLEAATRQGIAVVNAPTGNTFAAAEHTIALLMALSRNVPQADASLKQGEWRRSQFMGIEVRGKILGIIGLGRVGSEVARRALGLDMRVLAFDPYVTADRAARLGIELASFEEVLEVSDFITLHTPLTASTNQLIGEQELSRMKQGARLLNVARGGLIDETALLQAIESGQISGAGIDVFTQEPADQIPLVKSPKVISTPHLGASTVEAQAEVALEVAEQVVTVLQGKPAQYTVNMPFVPQATQELIIPYVQVAVDMGKIAIQLAKGQISSIVVRYQGEISVGDIKGLRGAILMGLLQPSSNERVNLVNSNLLAEQRDLRIVEENDSSPLEEYASLITLEISTSEGITVVSGTNLRGQTHLVRIHEDWVDATVEAPYLLFIDHRDQPGLIGAVGSITGENDINIAFMAVGRKSVRGRATMVVGLDDPMPDRVLKQVRSIPNLDDARLVRLNY